MPNRPTTPSGFTTIFIPCPLPSSRRPSSAGPRRPLWPATPPGSISARWSAATAIAIRPSTPRSPSTVDVASHGRLYAGIGAGWYEHEWKAYGYEWNDTPVRMRTFREAVEIIHQMWTEDYPDVPGRHYTIDRPINEPKNAGQGQDSALDRRRRRAGHPQAGRPVRGRLQCRWRQCRGHPPQARGPQAALRHRRPRLRRDHEIDQHRAARHRREGSGPREGDRSPARRHVA